MTTAQTKTKYIQLGWSDGNVVVTKENEDRYVVRVKKAIELLDLGRKSETFDAQFRLLLNRLGAWVKDRSDLSAAYLTMRDGVFAFVVIRTDAQYSADFEDELSDLDISIANDSDLNLVKLNTISLPIVSKASLEQFIDEGFSFRY